MELKNNELFKENCFIGGKWIESNSGEKIDVDNPANGEIIGKVPKCSTSETSKACLLYTSPSPRDRQKSRMPSSA